MENIGYKIRKIREIKNFKQEYMAEKLGISISAYSKVENNETVGPERLEQISKILGVSVEEILSFDETKVFNFINNYNNQNVGPSYNNFPADLKLLYEDKIKLLEDKIQYLIEENNRLKSTK